MVEEPTGWLSPPKRRGEIERENADLKRQLAEAREVGHDSFKLACMWQDQAKAAEAERDSLAAGLQSAKVEAGEAMLIVETQDQQIKRLAADNARLRERGLAFANQVRAVTYHLNGQAYSSTVSELNAFDSALAGKE
jgi:hypothetical protein